MPPRRRRSPQPLLMHRPWPRQPPTPRRWLRQPLSPRPWAQLPRWPPPPPQWRIATGPATVKVANNATLGNILVDANGMTLYLYAKDTTGVSNCTGACQTNWPPFLTNGTPVSGDTTITGVLGTIADLTGARRSPSVASRSTTMPAIMLRAMPTARVLAGRTGRRVVQIDGTPKM